MESNKRKPNAFDLLYVYDDDKMVRLPFSFRHLLKPIGIFPFAEDNRYIELEECENKKHTDRDVDTQRLLDVKFCNEVFKIKEQLNQRLTELKQPLLKGIYLAESDYMHGCGWLIGFDDNEFNTLSADYYGGNQPAKLRYQGKYNKKSTWKGAFFVYKLLFF